MCGNIFVAALRVWSAKHAPRLGAAVAFYALFSLAPLVVVVLGISTIVFGTEAVEGVVVNEFAHWLGPGSAPFLSSVISLGATAQQSVAASVIGSVILVLGAAGAFGQLRDALNTILGAPLRRVHGLRGFVAHNLFSFIMLLACCVLLVASGLLSTATVFLDVDAVSMGISLVLVAGVCALLYRYAPNEHLPWRAVLVGGLVASAIFHLGQGVFGLYLRTPLAATVLGAVGSLAALLLWLYVSVLILLYGAAICRASSA